MSHRVILLYFKRITAWKELSPCLYVSMVHYHKIFTVKWTKNRFTLSLDGLKWVQSIFSGVKMQHL